MFNSIRLSRFRLPNIGTGSILSFLVKLDADYRERRKLARLDNDRLDDIGLTRLEAEREILKPFWNVPGHWVR